MSTRATVTDTWGKPSRLATLNSTQHDTCVTFSVNDPTIYFVRCDPYNPNASYEPALATFDLWQAAVAPILDLNVDGTVDCADICILVDHWHTYNSWCDIAPAPLGDGFVDVQDLVLLVEEVTRTAAGANDIHTGR